MRIFFAIFKIPCHLSVHKKISMLYYIMPNFSAQRCKPKSPFSERGALACEGGVCDEHTKKFSSIPLLHGGVLVAAAHARSADGVVEMGCQN